ncbi:hypothetical protein JYK22_01695, partial [Nonomuraea sp. RK-328]|nr:hypothetical protein [Nonomuraea sp. RK-328]
MLRSADGRLTSENGRMITGRQAVAVVGRVPVVSLSYVHDDRDGRGWAFRERRGPGSARWPLVPSGASVGAVIGGGSHM